MGAVRHQEGTVSLHQLEVPATGGTHRLFQFRLADGTTILASLQGIRWSQLHPTPFAPNNTQVNEALTLISTAGFLSSSGRPG